MSNSIKNREYFDPHADEYSASIDIPVKNTHTSTTYDFSACEKQYSPEEQKAMITTFKALSIKMLIRLNDSYVPEAVRHTEESQIISQLKSNPDLLRMKEVIKTPNGKITAISTIGSQAIKNGISSIATTAIKDPIASVIPNHIGENLAMLSIDSSLPELAKMCAFNPVVRTQQSSKSQNVVLRALQRYLEAENPALKDQLFSVIKEYMNYSDCIEQQNRAGNNVGMLCAIYLDKFPELEPLLRKAMKDYNARSCKNLDGKTMLDLAVECSNSKVSTDAKHKRFEDRQLDREL